MNTYDNKIPVPFPSAEWGTLYAQELNACATYRDAASTWTYGAIAFVVRPDPDHVLSEGFALWLDVERGRCNEARVIALEEAGRAPFCITASYARWREVLERRLDPLAGMVTRRLALAGDLFTMMRYARSAQAMVHCATRVPSLFSHEKGEYK